MFVMLVRVETSGEAISIIHDTVIAAIPRYNAILACFLSGGKRVTPFQ